MSISFFSVCLIAAMLVGDASGGNAVEIYGRNSVIGFAHATGTNLSVRFTTGGLTVIPYQKRIVAMRSSEYMDEPLLLTTDHETVSVTDNEGLGIFFTPVAFKNGLDGFRITRRIWPGFGSKMSDDIVYFVALSDAPVEVCENDYSADLPVREKTSEELYAILRKRIKNRKNANVQFQKDIAAKISAADQRSAANEAPNIVAISNTQDSASSDSRVSVLECSTDPAAPAFGIRAVWALVFAALLSLLAALAWFAIRLRGKQR